MIYISKKTLPCLHQSPTCYQQQITLRPCAVTPGRVNKDIRELVLRRKSEPGPGTKAMSEGQTERSASSDLGPKLSSHHRHRHLDKVNEML